MLIGSRQRIATFRSVPCLEIDGVPIDKVLQAKSLGVYLNDENLSWNIQLNELTKKIASGIGALTHYRPSPTGWPFIPLRYRPLLRNLAGKKLSSQRQFKKAGMVYKSLNCLAPDYMHSMFVNRDSVNPYSLRNTENKLAVPKPRTNYLKNSFSYSGAVLWNCLPIGLRLANNLINFRSGCAKLF